MRCALKFRFSHYSLQHVLIIFNIPRACQIQFVESWLPCVPPWRKELKSSPPFHIPPFLIFIVLSFLLQICFILFALLFSERMTRTSIFISSLFLPSTPLACLPKLSSLKPTLTKLLLLPSWKYSDTTTSSITLTFLDLFYLLFQRKSFLNAF